MFLSMEPLAEDFKKSWRSQDAVQELPPLGASMTCLDIHPATRCQHTQREFLQNQNVL